MLLHIYEDIYYHAGGREHEAILSVEDWKNCIENKEKETGVKRNKDNQLTQEEFW